MQVWQTPFFSPEHAAKLPPAPGYLGKEVIEEGDRVSTDAVQFLQRGEALAPLAERLDQLLQKLEPIQTTQELGDPPGEVSNSTFAIFRHGESRSSCGSQLMRWSGGTQGGEKKPRVHPVGGGESALGQAQDVREGDSSLGAVPRAEGQPSCEVSSPSAICQSTSRV